ncbi:MAG: DUF1015 domain-containing protein [Gemmatimonadota bacterium]|jgi:uncharacterized protein (DUF1015 family)|nr:DUF1015 domain-containing protein [Gemmatimonadota bacterium]
MRFHPFRAWRPKPAVVAQVAAPPYDVVNRDEAARLAEGNPLSFLHVGRSDIDLPPETDPYDSRVYQVARENLDRFFRDGTFVQDEVPSVYLYEQVMDGRAQIGVVGCVHVDDYEKDVIRKHEKTRRDKEDDRTRHVLTLNANAEPVFLTVRDDPGLARLIADGVRSEPLYDFTAPDGVRHRVWRVADPDAFTGAFGRIPLCYVADGHHRCASAWRAGIERRAANPGHTGEEEYNWFLAVLFPAGGLRIMPYHRVIRDLNGQTPERVLARLQEVGRLSPVADPGPPRPGSFGIYLAKRWYRLELDPASIPSGDPIRSLDAALLEERVLGPILGIGDIRTDKRIDFVGGIRGTPELERRVNSGEMALAVAMYPVTVDQLMAVADAGAIMPPKTTWFEPKLRSGLFVHTLD